MSQSASERSIQHVHRWLVLAISVATTSCSFLFINCGVFLIPALHTVRGSSLTQAGLLAAMPSVGMVLTLVGWGFLVDRYGERLVLTAGLGLTAIAAFCAARQNSLVAIGVLLFLGGMAAASCNTAGARMVSGWFPHNQRGLAMGIRQTAQPLGVAIGAALMPELTEIEDGFFAALLYPGIACAVGAVVSFAFLTDPPRPAKAAAEPTELINPYRSSNILQRIHVVSALLMVAQSVTATFMLVWLIADHHWSTSSASALVGFAQLTGALGRIAVGRWSDRVDSRLRPMRAVAVAGFLALITTALFDYVDSPLAAPAMVVAAVTAVGYNGLAATAIVEVGGPFWTGRALGVQNTCQRLAAAGTPPAFGALVTAAGYPLAFAVCAVMSLAAVPLVPVLLERSD
ncbi:MFS transporter [Mycobacterium paraterrae]|uniref:MFS transporter n=1 Tax=Mycobacterium paraterrae TaxID=577492 RepID=A0ABY3VNB6_9MYCO|nr:MFS transporter [Mycobacterium paraterrae]UMB70936.1 MFS transporter [Mycobacterium paraterrae]